jgi:ABC-type transport system involved in cytochrome bd biosynthesis fused ATPase/permease subunit
MVTNGLVLGCALFLAWMHQATPGFVLAILVMLPRSLQIVMHIQIVQSYLAQWKRLEERLAVTYESVIEPKSIDLNPLIQKNGISIKLNNNAYPFEEIENLLHNHKTGRFTITGENGIGKSSLLLKLKDKFLLSAAYLPAQHQLSLSSGEIALASLKELQSSNCDVLLLDEWDANLSAENKAIVDQVINQLSTERIVVEIRHAIEKSGIGGYERHS